MQDLHKPFATFYLFIYLFVLLYPVLLTSSYVIDRVQYCHFQKPLYLFPYRLKDAPKASSVNTKSKKPSTFHEFARSTNDAWDIDDEEDDGMFSLKQPSSSPVQSRSMPQTPCLKIIKTPEDTEPLPHSLDRQEPISTNPDQDRLDIESGPANGRVVKSSSDAQLNVNAGMLVAVVFKLVRRYKVINQMWGFSTYL